MADLAIVASLVTLWIDAKVGSKAFAGHLWAYTSQPDGARAVLSTVAGSMITVAGVTFSMTIASVSYAAGQLGPRLMTNFMRDRGNQYTLGTFIATFLYSLMVLRTVRDGSDEGASFEVAAFVPQVSILARSHWRSPPRRCSSFSSTTCPRASTPRTSPPASAGTS